MITHFKAITVTLIFFCGLFVGTLYAEDDAAAQKYKMLEGLIKVLPFTAQESRDPFLSVFETTLLEEAAQADMQDLGQVSEEESAEPSALPTLIVEGILWGDGLTPMAVVNNQIVKEGDMIAGAKIKEITEESIEVFFKRRLYEVFSPTGMIRKQIKNKEAEK
ncbi:MAG: general secretion pathway protein GspB [Candidatus Omnitrophica bacterium]|nr:general secretion pathway protein GspB [Candidatus Omnitrophota bacterium]